MTKDLDSIRAFWESNPCNELFTNQQRGSRQYFAEMERKRFPNQYHLKDLFQRFANEDVEGESILEIGCGIGLDSFQLSSLGFREVVGLDLTETGIGVASQRREDEGRPNLRFIVGNAESMKFEDGTFDFVYSFGVIHHTPRIDRAASEIHRVLKPRGKAFVMLYHSTRLVNLAHLITRSPYVTNARNEAINAKIQWIKYTARGFRNRKRFRNAIYFHLGGLQLYPEIPSL